MFEIKGEGYARLTNNLPWRMAEDFEDQAYGQVEASGGRPVIWIFAEERAARFTRELFDREPGLERITVGYIPWIRRGRQ
jgi:NADPH-dependent ferric siderophore reductase